MFELSRSNQVQRVKVQAKVRSAVEMIIKKIIWLIIGYRQIPNNKTNDPAATWCPFQLLPASTCYKLIDFNGLQSLIINCFRTNRIYIEWGADLGLSRRGVRILKNFADLFWGVFYALFGKFLPKKSKKLHFFGARSPPPPPPPPQN